MSLLFAAAACFAERIRVNALSRETRDGRRLWIKRRRRSAPLVLAGANQFFRLARNPVQAITNRSAWQRWEVECFLTLHEGKYHAFADGTDSVAAEEIPGTSLAQHLEWNSLTPAMTAAAARELRRCHSTSSALAGGSWSHGDPHAGNFLYDAPADRARLIDFEVQHASTLSADERHADDLLVFLQDVVGRVSAAAWLPLANAFLSAYERPAVLVRLAPRLILPRGIPRLWWAVRTSYLAGAELSHRLELLRESLLLREVTNGR